LLFFGAGAALERSGPDLRKLFKAEYAAVDEARLFDMIEQ
jgi:hypothetical protein